MEGASNNKSSSQVGPVQTTPPTRSSPWRGRPTTTNHHLRGRPTRGAMEEASNKQTTTNNHHLWEVSLLWRSTQPNKLASWQDEGLWLNKEEFRDVGGEEDSLVFTFYFHFLSCNHLCLMPVGFSAWLGPEWVESARHESINTKN